MSGVYNQGPVREERDTTLRDLIAVLFKRKWLILTFFLVTTGIVAGRTAMQEDTYSADARLLLKRQGARSSVLERNPRVLPWVEVVETELEVIQTEPVMRRAVEKLKRPTEDFPDGIDVNIFEVSRAVSAGVMNESNVLYVEGTAEGPLKAVAITNAVAESYVEYHRELFKLPEVQGGFAVQADSVFKELEAARVRRQSILDEFGLTDFREEERTLMRQRGLVGGNLIEFERRIARLEVEVDDISSIVEGDRMDVPIAFNTGTVQGGSVVNTLQRLRTVESQLETMRGRYTEAHPERQELERDARRLRAEMQANVQMLVDMKTHELRVARREADSLRESLAEIEQRMARIPEATRRLASLNTRIEGLEDQYEKFSDYMADSQATSKSFEEYSAEIISRALRAQKNSKADPVRLALAPLLALMAGIFAAFYMENMDHSLGTREDVERHLDIPVLASFPESEMDESSAETVEDEARRKAPFRRSRSQEA